MYYEPYEYERPRWWMFAAAGAAALLVLSVVAFWQLGSGSGAGDSSAVDTSAETTSSVEESTTTNPASTAPKPVAATTADEESDQPAGETSVPGASEVAATVTGASETSLPAGEGESPVPYPASPDGAPLPLVVIFDVETITISGQVPSQAARERLGGLALANSQFPDAQVIDNMVVNPAVPTSVGVRVIELNSARFPEGTAEILPDHALELDRVVAIMQALPNISVLVVGHADQRGDDLANFAISDERARAVVNYLLYLGISQTRLASRAAGESDLLTIGDDSTSLALNRRTEFVFYGLLIE